MSRLELDDIERLKERIAVLIEHFESKVQRRKDSLRELLRVGEIKICVENICSLIADDEIEFSPEYQWELLECCKILNVDESHYWHLK